jgi:hypothetical protein
MASNYEVALKAEMKRVTRCFQSYTSEQRANHADSFKLGIRQRHAVGEFYYVHPDVPGKAFPRRKLAATYAMTSQQSNTASQGE